MNDFSWSDPADVELDLIPELAPAFCRIDRTVLEIFCGSKRLSSSCLIRGMDVIGVDINVQGAPADLTQAPNMRWAQPDEFSRSESS